MKKLFTLFLISFIFLSCDNNDVPEPAPLSESSVPMDTIYKPYARYWWFASEIQKDDVRYNLDWLKSNGFGGIELAWVYPLNAMDTTLDSSYTPRQPWLSPEWQEIVEYTILYADSLGLACDMTMGTLWPFGDSQVEYSRAAQVFGSEERQKIRKSWEHPELGYVVDHLDSEKYLPYFRRMLNSFPAPETSLNHAFFVDSWEVEAERIWADNFSEDFEKKFGYDISPFMDSIYSKRHEMQLYDYMSLVSDKVIDFYKNYDSVLNSAGHLSRGQCSGAPADIISVYAQLDIPEGEAMLYEPEFNSIPASAALLSGKKSVSAETFTCLYGWPRHYIRREQVADLKLVADALFANGVNHVIWHGKPHNPAGSDSVNFYASVHLGPDGSLAAQLPEFNNYLAKISGKMKEGRTYSDAAVYLPTEDAWIKGKMPKEKQFIWAWGYYEMRYNYFPEGLAGHHPVWINREFLEKSEIVDGKLLVGNAEFNSLYIDVDYIDARAFERIFELAELGFPIFLIKNPVQAGTDTMPAPGFREKLAKMRQFPNVKSKFEPVNKPLITGKNIPPYWARITESGLNIFFANPKSRGLKFPVEYGQSFSEDTVTIPAELNYNGKAYPLNLVFEPYQSKLFELKNGKLNETNIEFKPETPVVIPRPDDFETRWLVK